eukprot:1187248-Rhodomonas_salina.1
MGGSDAGSRPGAAARVREAPPQHRSRKTGSGIKAVVLGGSGRRSATSLGVRAARAPPSLPTGAWTGARGRQRTGRKGPRSSSQGRPSPSISRKRWRARRQVHSQSKRCAIPRADDAMSLLGQCGTRSGRSAWASACSTSMPSTASTLPCLTPHPRISRDGRCSTVVEPA